MNLDLSPFKKALASMEKALKRSSKDPGDDELRDAVIQRFEYSYELSWKMLKRQLEKEMPTPADVDQFSFRELLREGAERGLVGNIENWMAYRELRNLTSHTYDEDKADQVRQQASQFFKDASDLLIKLEKRNG